MQELPEGDRIEEQAHRLLFGVGTHCHDVYWITHLLSLWNQ